MALTAGTEGRIDHQLEALARHEAPHSFSILIPTHRKHPETDQDPIRFKNALDDVAGRLEASGVRGREVEQLLTELRDHLGDRGFWQHRDLGFAAFGAPGVDPIEIDMPVSPAPVVHVGRRFRIRPLVAALDELSVPVLVLARGDVALYELVGREARSVDCDLPASMTDLNWFVDREPRLQQRTQPPSAVGGPFHGHAPDEDEDEDLRRYLDAIAAEIGPIVDGRNVPLVVAAPGTMSSEFSRYLDHEVVPHPAIEGSADGAGIAEAVDGTRKELLEQHRSSIRSRYADALGRGKAVEDFEEALEAGATGRIEGLGLVPDGEPIWGRFDEASLQLDRHDDRHPGDEDLVDRLIGLTLANGGRVDPIDSPIDGHWFVAISRYEAS